MTLLWKKLNRLGFRGSLGEAEEEEETSHISSSSDTIFVNNFLLEEDKQRDSKADFETPPWLQTDISRESAARAVSRKGIGCFVVRSSGSNPGCYALTVRVPRYTNQSGISHYLVTMTHRGTFKIKGLAKEWPNLASLVTHHMVMKEMLPCTLKLSHPIASSRGQYEDDDYEEADEDEELKESKKSDSSKSSKNFSH